MPWLTLTIPSLTTCLCSLVCRSHVERLGTQQQSMAKVAILHELCIITRAMYYVGSTLIPFSQVSSSSVKPNEQMLLSCWSQYDGLSCWQTYPSAVRKWKGSSGQWTACQGALTLLHFSPFSFRIADLISDIQESFHPEAPPPALYHPLSCPSEPLSNILFNLSPTCNVPLSTTEEARKWKGQNISNKVRKTLREARKGRWRRAAE